MLTVFGSINLDVSVRSPRLPRPGETLLGTGALLSPGGKGANQAHAAQRFGMHTQLFGMVGDDAFARPALERLMHAGVDVTGVGATATDPTGLALITVSDVGENTIVVAPGANLAARAAQVPDAVLQASRVLLLQLEVPLSESLALARRARTLGCKVVLNASPLPPDAALDVSAIPGADLMARARVLAASLHVDVLVTLGAEGSFLARANGEQAAARALAVTPVDTTGAGDTYAGVLCAAMASGEPPQRAMDFAAVAAGLACLRCGAQVAQPTRSEIDERMSDTQ